MTQQEMDTRLRDLVARVADRDLGGVSADADIYRDLGVKSTRALDLLLSIEEEFDVSISDEAFGSARTMAALARLIGREDAPAAGTQASSRVLREFAGRGGEASVRDVYEDLVARGWIFELGRGQIGLADTALELARGLDRAFARLGRERFDAREHSYPMLIPSEVLQRCGYFASFPHLASMVSPLGGDYEALNSVGDSDTEGARAALGRAPLAPPQACLSPSICFHCYQALEGTTVPSPGTTFTASGRCGRYEAARMGGLERLWDFTMREWIFVGRSDWVHERRAEAIDAVAELATSWDLSFRIQGATDPFFAPVAAVKSFYQSSADLKYELVLPVGAGHGAGEAREIAAGSFNLHESFFGDVFRLSAADGAAAVTGCVGFGLERWVLACFAQHGLDPARWPATLRDALVRGGFGHVH